MITKAVNRIGPMPGICVMKTPSDRAGAIDAVGAEGNWQFEMDAMDDLG